MAEGFFIVVEGIDGSGKGTAIKGMREWLASKGLGRNSVFSTREPSDSAHGKKAREILRSGDNPKERAEELLLLYLKDRAGHLEKEIIPALRNGKIVICDRYKYSTVAYQAAQGIDIKGLVEKNRGFRKPDLAIILDITAKDAIRRIEGDSGRDAKEMFEKKEFLEKARANFLKMPGLFADENIIIINASGNREKVLGKIKSELESSLMLDSFK